MGTSIKQLFKKVTYIPEDTLPEVVWHSIVLHKKRHTQIRLWVFSIFGCISLGGLVPLVKSIIEESAQSGLYEYVKLAFSGNEIIVSSWRELLGSIVDSFPTTSVTITLVGICVLFISAQYIAKEFSKNQMLVSF